MISLNSFFCFFSCRRVRDRQLQDRIREITGKILRRRGEVRGNAYEEKHQAELEIREVNNFAFVFPFQK